MVYKDFIKFYPYFLRVKWYFIFAILAGVVASVASGLGVPFMCAKVFPVVFDNAQLPDWMLEYGLRWVGEERLHSMVLLAVCMFVPLVFVVRGVATVVNTYLTGYVGIRILEFLRIDAFTKLQHLPLAFHEREQKGDLISRLVNDTQSVQQGITQISNDLIKQPMILLSAVAFIIYQAFTSSHTALVMVNLIMIAAVIWPVQFFGKRVVVKARRAQEKLGNMTAVVQENLVSQREVRAYAMQDQQVGLLAGLTKQFYNVQLKAVKYQQLLTPLLEIVSALGLAFLLIRGFQLGMSQADFLALAAALFMSYDPIKRISVSYNRLKQCQASLERINYILEAQETIPEPVQPTPLALATGDLAFDSVDFAYHASNPVLKNVCVRVHPGDVVGLVGPSGAGKTTFINLVLRFYDVTCGAVYIDGVDVRDVTNLDLRRQIALVSQHPMLFSGSIRENIRLGRQDATDAQVEAAAKSAAAHDFIMSMPDGYETVLGDAGSGLSGGQRQRVSIARAFLKDAPILILDEATASLDAESEQQIQHQLEQLMQGRTTLIIAHRFSTIRAANRILVFEHGRVIADAPHATLYAECPLYKELYDKQSL